MVDLVFRDAKQSDLNIIVAIYNSTISSRMVTADTEPVSVQSRQSWFAAHDKIKRPLWMIETIEGSIVAWVSFQSFYGRPAYDATVEISIYLAEEFRGTGFGKQILKQSILEAKKRSIKTLLAYIFEHNSVSVKLFEYFGFQVWGKFPNIAVLDEVERTLLILGKRIKE